MIRLIIYKELKEIIGSAKFAVTFGVCSVLIILAFFTGAKNYQSSMQEYQASKAANLQKFEGMTNWEEVNGHEIFLPPEPLAALVVGISNDLGRAVGINGSDTPVAVNSYYSEQPVFAVFRFMDLEFVFQIILSLFAILFAYDAVNGEKERGTLRLSFANSLSRADYIFGKLTGSFLALAIPLLLPVLLGILILPLMGITLSVNEWIRLGLFITTGLLYLGVFLTLSVFISCLTQRSSSAFLFLLVIWVCSVLIVPRASVLIAGNMVEVPSQESINSQRIRLMTQLSGEMQGRLQEFFQKHMERPEPGKMDPEMMQRNQDRINELLNEITDEQNKKIDNLTARLNEERNNIQIQQEKLAFNISRISPTAVFKLAATTLSGTSLDLKTHFLQQAATYSKTYAEFMSEKTGRNVGGGPRFRIIFREGENTEPPKPINPRELPEFRYQPPELSVVLASALPDMAILIIFNMVFFAGAFVSFLRYDLR